MKPKIFVNSAESLEKTLHQLIPISQHMGIRVTDYTGSELTLEAPLSNNINHQQTAFGGSLFSLAALAGWGLLQLKLCELNIDANTVVASGEINYSLPVRSALVCVCCVPNDWPFFLEKLQSKGKASIELTASIMTGDAVAMQLGGRYVISLRKA